MRFVFVDVSTTYTRKLIRCLGSDTMMPSVGKAGSVSFFFSSFVLWYLLCGLAGSPQLRDVILRLLGEIG
jgi:hypothetical protein